MIPLTTWSNFGPEIVGAILAGLVAGLTAWLLLRRTQRDEARIRNEARASQELAERKKVARLVLRQVRDLADLMTSTRPSTISKSPTWPLRNEIAVAGFDLSAQLLGDLKRYAMYCREFRDWVRHAPEAVVADFGRDKSSAGQQLVMSQRAIAAYAATLGEALLSEGRGVATESTYEDFPSLAPWSRSDRSRVTGH